MIPPTKRQMDGIIEYLENEGFIKPPKKIALCVMKFNR